MGSILCEHCTGVCCKYVALPLDSPENKRDFDDIRWYLLHSGVTIFVEEGDWYLQFQAKCKQLMPDNRCSIYETRPKICREYSTKNCDYHGGEYEYDHLFTVPDEIDAFAAAFLKSPKKKGKKKSKAKRRPRSHAAATPQKLYQLRIAV